MVVVVAALRVKCWRDFELATSGEASPPSAARADASSTSRETCGCDIPDVGVSQPTVSHHLRKLREAGMLTSERRGTWVYYRVAPDVLAAMAAMLAPSG